MPIVDGRDWGGPLGALAQSLDTNPMNVLVWLTATSLASMALGARLYNGRGQYTYRWVVPLAGAVILLGTGFVQLKSTGLGLLTGAMLTLFLLAGFSVFKAGLHVYQITRRITTTSYYEPSIALFGVHSFLVASFTTLAAGCLGILLRTMTDATLTVWYNATTGVGAMMLALAITQAALVRKRIKLNRAVEKPAASAPRALEPARVGDI